MPPDDDDTALGHAATALVCVIFAAAALAAWADPVLIAWVVTSIWFR